MANIAHPIYNDSRHLISVKGRTILIHEKRGHRRTLEISAPLVSKITHALNPPTRGQCQYCHCTEDDPCYFVPVGDFDVVPCAWDNTEETLCCHPRCLARHEQDKKPPGKVPDWFVRGIGYALGSLARHYNQPLTAADILKGAGLSKQDLKDAGVDPYDLKHIPNDKKKS